MGQPYINAQPVDNLGMLPALITPEVPLDLHRCRLGPASASTCSRTSTGLNAQGHEVEGRGAEQGV
ncbi:hypothetical protein LY13_003624 [Prauserella aidingensis]|nr:hypothetical protein [Prauserella aidingensis]